MIEIDGLHKSFGNQVIFKGLSLTVDKEIVGLIGANGTGKTTLFKCLLGLSDYSGDISINGFNIRKNSLKTKEMLGYIPQFLPIWPDLEVVEVVRFFCKLREASFEKRGLLLLEELGLIDHLRKKIFLLSGGMRQKLSIVIALLSDPKVLLLDEPTANLDAWATKGILEVIDGWKGSKSIIFASHRLEELKTISDRIVQLHQGNLMSPKTEDISLDGPLEGRESKDE